MYVTASDKVREMVKAGEYKAALKRAKDFRLGVSKDDSRAMRRAYECYLYGAFYSSLGMDPNAEIVKGVEVLIKLYGTTERKEARV